MKFLPRWTVCSLILLLAGPAARAEETPAPAIAESEAFEPLRAPEVLPRPGTVTVVGFAGYSNVGPGVRSRNAEFEAQGRAGWGVTGRYALSQPLSIEFVASIFKRAGSISIRGTSTELGDLTAKYSFNNTWAQIAPVGRLWLTPRFSIGVGPSLSFALGTPRVALRLNSDKGSGQGSGSFEQAGWNSFDVGLLGVIGYQWPLSEQVSVNLEGRFDQGFTGLQKTVAAGSVNPHNHGATGLVGIGYML